MKPVLVLDSSYRPIKQISWKKAMTLYFQEKIEVIKEYQDTWIRSPNKKFKLPSVIRMIDYIFRLPWGIRLTRANLFVRDKGQCQYCRKKLNRGRFTLDHVIPKSKGGSTDWNNLVVSCERCNIKKGDKSLKEVGFTLNPKPCQPKTSFLFTTIEEAPADWLDFLAYTY
jgi:5-methylcytosine-specific restriction endonuclease McrA